MFKMWGHIFFIKKRSRIIVIASCSAREIYLTFTSTDSIIILVILSFLDCWIWTIKSSVCLQASLGIGDRLFLPSLMLHCWNPMYMSPPASEFVVFNRHIKMCTDRYNTERVCLFVISEHISTILCEISCSCLWHLGTCTKRMQENAEVSVL